MREDVPVGRACIGSLQRAGVGIGAASTDKYSPSRDQLVVNVRTRESRSSDSFPVALRGHFGYTPDALARLRMGGAVLHRPAGRSIECSERD